MSARMRTAAAVALAALTVGGATSTAAQAAPHGGGKAKVTCEAGGGVKASPGDEMVTTTVIRNARGKIVGRTTYTQICGEDGQWHTVAKLTTGTVPGPALTTATTRTVVER